MIPTSKLHKSVRDDFKLILKPSEIVKTASNRFRLVYRIATFTDFEMILRIEKQLETIPSNFMVFGTFGMLIQGIIPNADALVFSSFFKVTVTEQIEHFLNA